LGSIFQSLQEGLAPWNFTKQVNWQPDAWISAPGTMLQLVKLVINFASPDMAIFIPKVRPNPQRLEALLWYFFVQDWQLKIKVQGKLNKLWHEIWLDQGYLASNGSFCDQMGMASLITKGLDHTNQIIDTIYMPGQAQDP